ncbi:MULTISPECIES: ribbon-helix-helix domain-containing protein [unclassified Devosia]|uniref:ribbon-helix-helix domain-containing protein n=1 Tax=unclassified Devosia TaxID=196773 RepID=UPI00145E14FA|nr:MULTISPECIES: ribbon-helix-helix domain-containing protein [unclassified Devosia]MBJ6986602.1 ribbon-helix-helix domain-containing protein [Devosia sp. MC521]QMW61642.1 ribbon-helix-helix domain-containing protein [Devosia sp. MC521]
MDKRSFSIVGHRTSIALEPAFWAGLEAMAQQRGLSLAGLVRHIDETRDTQNLSSAVRLAVLAYYRDGEALARPTDPKAKAE